MYMKTTLYSVTIPVFINNLQRLSGILDKASAHTEMKNGDLAVLLAARLAPDQFPFIKQLQLASDTAKAFAPRLVGADPVSMDDTETTAEELKQRLDATIAILKEVKPEDVDGKEDVQVRIKWFPGKYLTAFDYAMEYALPNFYFHMTTAYSILRHEGVELGKTDFLQALSLQDDVSTAS